MGFFVGKWYNVVGSGGKGMFRGLSAVTIDAKGRFVVPVRLRSVVDAQAEGRLVVTIDTREPCLLMYPLSTWEEIEVKLTALSSFNPATRRIQRLLIGHATELEMDRNGRVLLPQLLREYAGLGQNIMLVGQGNKCELWGETQWYAACDSWVEDEKEQQGGELSGDLASLSL
jgi:MraZ protein